MTDWTTPPGAILTGPEAAARAGFEWEMARRFWRALGMPEVAEEDPAFDDLDVEALVSLRMMMEAGVAVEDLIAITRVVGRSFATLADAEIHQLRKLMMEPGVETALVEDPESAVPLATRVMLSTSLAPMMDARRHHILAAVREELTGAAARDQLAVGFADLVNFSRLSDHLGEESLGTIVTRFEEIVVRACADNGTRLVKMIGDAAMFSSPEPARALATALVIVEQAHAEEFLPEARAGLDLGDAVGIAGDYFGRVVNVAARATAFARPGTVVITRPLKDTLNVATGRIGLQRLKGVGVVDLYKVRATTSDSSVSSR